MLLIINSGSTSLKYKLFKLPNLREIQSGYIENIGQKGCAKNHEEALKFALKKIVTRYKLYVIRCVGHRIVHGGDWFTRPTKVTPKILKKLEKYNKLAPLHNPPNLDGIKASQKLMPKVANFACFDTAFHRTLPEYIFRYALPEKYFKKYSLRRFGFHGLSHQYSASEAAKKLKKPLGKLKIITCHLGGGSSICAIKNGKSIETSMGFTPAEGLIMASRCGDIDPTISLFLQKKERLTPDEMDKILNFESGILAICGEKNWLKVLARLRRGDKRAKLAFDMFCHRVKKYIGAYYAILGGLEALVFTGAIGSGDSLTRSEICRGLPFLGSSASKGVKIFAIKTNEELMIAKEIVALLHC
ncbi:MAG: acetate/propionate family kinase [Patescibacteria group bacterium]